MPHGLLGIVLEYTDCMLHHGGLYDSCAKQDPISNLVTPWVIFYAIAVVASLVAIFMKVGVFIQQLRCRSVWPLKFQFSYCWMKIMAIFVHLCPATGVQLRHSSTDTGIVQVPRQRA